MANGLDSGDSVKGTDFFRWFRGERATQSPGERDVKISDLVAYLNSSSVLTAFAGGGDVTSAEFVRLQALLATNFQEDILRASSSGINARGVLHDNYSSDTYVDTANTVANRITADNAYRTATASSHSLLIQSEVATTHTDGEDDFYDASGNAGVLSVTGRVQTEIPAGTGSDVSPYSVSGTGQEPIVDIDGTGGDYISIPDSSVWDLSNNDFTIATWVKVPNVTGFKAILSAYDTDSAWQLLLSDDEVYFGYNFGTPVNLTTATNCISADTWHYVVVRREASAGNTIKIFVDENEEASVGVSTNSFVANTSDVFVGIRAIASELPFNGKIADLRVWNGSAESATRPLTKPAVGTEDFYLGHDITNTTFTDTTGVHGDSLTGSITNTNVRHTLADPKFDSTCAYFNGSADFSIADTASANDFELDANGTVDTFVKFESLGSAECIMMVGDETSDYTWKLSKTAGDELTFQSSSTGASYDLNALTTSGITIVAGTWHHVRVVVNGASSVLYFDGVSEATATIGSVRQSTNGVLLVGKNSGGTERFTGYLEEYSVAPTVTDRGATAPSVPYSLAVQNFRLPSVAIECDVAPTKVYAQITVESGAPYDTVVANTDIKAYIAQTGNENPDDGGFVGNELTLVPAGTTADGYMLYEVENQAITGGTVDGNKFIVHGPNADDFRVHDATVLLS